MKYNSDLNVEDSETLLHILHFLDSSISKQFQSSNFFVGPCVLAYVWTIFRIQHRCLCVSSGPSSPSSSIWWLSKIVANPSLRGICNIDWWHTRQYRKYFIFFKHWLLEGGHQWHQSPGTGIKNYPFQCSFIFEWMLWKRRLVEQTMCNRKFSKWMFCPADFDPIPKQNQGYLFSKVSSLSCNTWFPIRKKISGIKAFLGFLECKMGKQGWLAWNKGQAAQRNTLYKSWKSKKSVIRK